jgi:hypothetical protein
MLERKMLGPRVRLTPIERCACGLSFTTYWRHRQTKQHKDAVKRWRREARQGA